MRAGRDIRECLIVEIGNDEYRRDADRAAARDARRRDSCGDFR
jgi:hypothetical protein